MKKLVFPLCFLLASSGFGQTGYEIKVTFKPFKNQYIYLGHYFGKTYPIIDSALLNDKSEAVFKGTKKLPGGVYLIGYPKKTGFFEFLVDKHQRFSVIADTATIRNGVKFINSQDNVLFTSYQQFMATKGKEVQDAQQKLKTAANQADSVKRTAALIRIDDEVKAYRNNFIKNNPNHILSAMLITLKEPQLTGRLKEPKNKVDSLDAYNYYKSHFWDGVDFWDGRLAYTNFFEDKIDKYFAQLVAPHPDSIILELDRMLGPASINEEMTRFLLVKFANRYLNQKYMFEDAIFVHLFEKYFAQKEYPWLNAQGRKVITDRAYNLMANILGTPAADIDLPDSAGVVKPLYADTSSYTMVVFWDPTCGHCKEVLPKLDSFYHASWKAGGLKIYAVAKETDGSKKDWLNFINEYKLSSGWTHVYYSKAADKARIDASTPGYAQLYDVTTYPTLYLLDKDKRIVAKKLAYDQMDEVFQVKLKGE
jgi:thiol-disulfide isomerase/thioredoxin